MRRRRHVRCGLRPRNLKPVNRPQHVRCVAYSPLNPKPIIRNPCTGLTTRPVPEELWLVLGSGLDLVHRHEHVGWGLTPNPKLGTRNSKSYTRNPEPDTQKVKLKTRYQGGGLRSSCPKTCALSPSPRSETRNPRPETPNPRPQTRNPKPETRDPRPETRSPKPEN